MAGLPVGRIWGVGKKMGEKLHALGIETCADLQELDPLELSRRFGNWGIELWSLCRGVDARPVLPHRIRKSASSETTFAENVQECSSLLPTLHEMLGGLTADLAASHADRGIRSLVVKLKFADFNRTTAERASHRIDPAIFEELLAEAWSRADGRSVRLLGVGVRFEDPKSSQQLDLFNAITLDLT